MVVPVRRQQRQEAARGGHAARGSGNGVGGSRRRRRTKTAAAARIERGRRNEMQARAAAKREEARRGRCIYRGEGGGDALEKGKAEAGRTRRRRRCRGGSGLCPEVGDEWRGRRGLAGPWPGWLAGPAQLVRGFFLNKHRQRKKEKQNKIKYYIGI